MKARLGGLTAATSLGLASCLLALGCSGSGAHPAAVPGVQWRLLAYGHRHLCLPVATTTRAQERGLQGLTDPVPMAFAFAGAPAGYRPAFWMKDTPVALIGIWVAAAGHRVLGDWRGRPYSLHLHSAPAPVSYVIEFPRQWWSSLPAVGSRVALGSHCPPGNRL